MELFTGKGDTGTTKTFGCEDRISKNSSIVGALGSVDEVNSYLGLCKVKSKEGGFTLGQGGPTFEAIVHGIQANLFIVQAELAGAPKKIEEQKVREIENYIKMMEAELPPIRTFFISGGTELAAHFDFARTVARRAERRVVAVREEGIVVPGEHTMAYLNRLSSILYALARLSNHKSAIKEEPPSYK
ncbi:MAG: cob(I)yrinic acid a,c-diamide adenosyltransferase [bacterium]|nr:cob(I)yrinic acid a,c-diamide adenosyltransferase [bacterium]